MPKTRHSSKTSKEISGLLIQAPIFYSTPEEFDADWHRHRVSPDSPHYITPRGKFGYPLTEVEAEPNPRVLTTRGNKARSLL